MRSRRERARAGGWRAHETSIAATMIMRYIILCVGKGYPCGRTKGCGGAGSGPAVAELKNSEAGLKNSEAGWGEGGNTS